MAEASRIAKEREAAAEVREKEAAFRLSAAAAAEARASEQAKGLKAEADALRTEKVESKKARNAQQLFPSIVSQRYFPVLFSSVIPRSIF